MGGHALNKVVTRRYEREEYFQLVNEVLHQLETCFPNAVFKVIPAYGDKPSFGDMDILTNMSVGATADTLAAFTSAFQPTQIVQNGSVLSFDYKAFQIDLIYASPAEFAFSYHYFSYNDMGNLLGKIGHKFGVKYGHDGLWYLVREGDYLQDTFLLTDDPEKALAFLGLTAPETPFKTLEDIFAYVSSSPFFNAEYYLKSDSDKNATDRVRENKRPSYQAFLTWLAANRDRLPQFQPNRDKKVYFDRIEEHFPGFKAKYETAKSRLMAIAHQKAVIDAKFDPKVLLGDMGVSHEDKKQFGKIMAAFTSSFVDKEERQTWLYNASVEEIKARLLQIKENINGR